MSKIGNNVANPFLIQRQIRDLVRSLSKEQKRALGQAIINIHNDAKLLPLDKFVEKYDL